MKSEASHKSFNGTWMTTLTAALALSAGLLLGGCPADLEQIVRNLLTDPNIKQEFKGAAGEDGQDGPDGADGQDGSDGQDGADGLACWDLNGNGVKDPEEDANGDGVVNVLDCKGTSGTPGTVVLPMDHGQLAGLGDDDHPQYIAHNETDSVTTPMIANGAVALGKIDPSKASNGKAVMYDGNAVVWASPGGGPPSGPAGGDLTGNYPDPQIADGAVGSSKLAAESVDSSKVIDESLEASDLAPNSVGSSEIASDAVGSDEIRMGAVGSSELAPEAVTSESIRNGTIKVEDVEPAFQAPNADKLDGLDSTDFALRPHHTLDDAYDQGSPGAGRTITADSGAVSIDGPDGLTVSADVGIGTTNPSQKLQVVGNIAVSGTIDGVDISAHVGDANAHHTPPTTLPPSGDAGGDLFGTYPDPEVVDDSHEHGDSTISDSLSIDNGRLYAPAGSGDVGIGTSTPEAKFHVAGTPGVDGIMFPDGTLQTTAATGGGDGNTLDESYDQGGPGAGRIITADSGAVSIDGSDGLTVSGAVGIGTTDPSQKLDVVGNIALTGNIDGVDISAHVADANAHHTPPEELPPSGNAGGDLTGVYPNPQIRTGAVTAAHLANDSVTTDKIGNRAVTDEKIQSVRPEKIEPQGSGSGLDADTVDGKHASELGSQWQRNGSDIYYNEGNVGIGRTSPGAKLDVNGRAVFNQVNVNGSGSETLYVAGTGAITGDFTVEGNLTALNGEARFNRVNINGSGEERLWVGGDGYVAGTLRAAGRIVKTFSGDDVAELNRTTQNAGFAGTKGTNGRINGLITNLDGFPNNGYIAVADSNGILQAGMYVNSAGRGVIFKDIINFRVPNPSAPGTEIWYAAPEGPEAAAYIRGTAQLVEGGAFVPFPEHFRAVMSHQGVTIQLTPRSAESKGLAIVDETIDGFEVRELLRGTGTYQFDYMVMAVRAGYEDYRVIRDASEVQPALPVEDQGDEDD